MLSTYVLLVGLFFVLPCIETYTKVDLRTITLDVPPQEVVPGVHDLGIMMLDVGFFFSFLIWHATLISIRNHFLLLDIPSCVCLFFPAYTASPLIIEILYPNFVVGGV